MKLVLTNLTRQKRISRPIRGLHLNGFRQLIVNGVSGVLDGDRAAATLPADDSDRLSGIAAQGEQELVQLLIVGHDCTDDILLAHLGRPQIHRHPSRQLVVVSVV